jgi:hypothetical protein
VKIISATLVVRIVLILGKKIRPLNETLLPKESNTKNKDVFYTQQRAGT